MLHRRPQRSGPSELDRYRNLALTVMAQAAVDLCEPLYARGAARFLKRLDPEKTVWAAWVGVHGRSLRPEVLAAIEKVLAGKARVVPRQLLHLIPTPAEAPDLLVD